MSTSKKFLPWSSILLLLGAGLLTAYVIFLLIRNRIQDKAVQDKLDNDPEFKDVDMSQADEDSIKAHFKAINDVCKANNVDSNYAIALTGQAIHESSDEQSDGLYHPFSSNLYNSNHNMFGMRHPVERETTSKGERNGYAYFATIADCVKDRLLWDHAKNEASTIEDTSYTSIAAWVRKLKTHNYFEANVVEYIAGTWNGVKEIKSLISAG